MVAEPASSGGPSGPVLDPQAMSDTNLPITPSRRPAAPSIGTSPQAKRLMAHVQVQMPTSPQNLGIGEITAILQKMAQQQDEDHIWMSSIVQTIQDHAERIDATTFNHLAIKKDLITTVETVRKNDANMKQELYENDMNLKKCINSGLGGT